jgi:sulfur carrier protein
MQSQTSRCGAFDRVEFPWLPREHALVEIVLNGEPRAVPNGASTARLIELLALGGRRLAVEVNGEIVPRSLYAAHELKAGDRVEIVHAVGGG